MFINYVPPPDIGGPSLKGDPNLVPEKVSTVDAGISYEGVRFQAGLNYFYSILRNNIELVDSTANGRYANVGKTIFQGVELEGKYYVKKHWYLTGSGLYQANRDSEGNRNVTPVANLVLKAGLSYESPKALTAGVFDAYQGHVPGYDHAVNPQPEPFHLLNAHVRYDMARYLPAHSKTGLALVAHAENLTGQSIWLPDWKDSPGNSIFYNRGRTVYAGLEFSLKKE